MNASTHVSTVIRTNPQDDKALIQELRAGSESAFVGLVTRYNCEMIRVALCFVRDEATAQEVVQDAWLGVLKGLATFEGRSTLKSWIFSIVVNQAKTRGVREARSIPFSSLAAQEASGTEPAVDPSRFLGPDEQWPGHWAQPPQSWGQDPEACFLQAEMMGQLAHCVESLPSAQRTVLLLRNVAGHDADSICNTLGITMTNMRVLLHRARSKLRNELERYRSELPASAQSTQ
jgi:RNA polymerase sigma-70 factor (ECF subfamily)